MIKSFDCSGFRNISCHELTFERVNILIGPNNAGKSNFIRAISFAANMVSNPLVESTHFLSEIKRNGWNAVANKDNKTDSFQLSWTLDLLGDGPVKYTLDAKVGKKRDDNYITSESLDSARKKEGFKEPYNYFKCHSWKRGVGEFSTAGMANEKNTRLQTRIDPTETVLVQMDNLFFENKQLFNSPFVRDNIRYVLEVMRTYFKSFYSYSCTAFNLSKIRELQDEQADGSFLKKDGSNFVNCYATALDKDSTFKKRFLNLVEQMEHRCSGIELRSVGGKLWMELEIDEHFFPLSEISDGTVHLLLLALFLCLPQSYGISMLAMDEPEMNLHPAWQKLLAHEIIRSDSFKQCFISTHSPDFLDEFTDEFLSGDVGIFVFDPSSRFSIRKLDRDELQADLTSWTLGDLYRVGDPTIGGWPQ